MTIDDKLRLLKKERDARVRSRNVEDAWKKIDKEAEALTVKEKLERLISLTGGGKYPPKPAASPSPGPLHRDPFRFIENPYALGTRYGDISIALGLEIPGKALAFLSHDEEFELLTLESALFLDLETTGLAGGTGTVPFLVGMGYFRDGKFKVTQYFLGEMADEDAMIRELAGFIREMGFKSVVTYNGKAFDLPLLETRFALHRERFPARRPAAPRFPVRRPPALEAQVRELPALPPGPADRPGRAERGHPRGRDPDALFPVHPDRRLISHRAHPLSQPGGPPLAAGRRHRRGPAPRTRPARGRRRGEGPHGPRTASAGSIESAGDAERSAELFEQALKRNLSGELSVRVHRKLSHHFKKNQDWDKAVVLWQDLARRGPARRFRELAMYYEHKEKKYDEALRAAEEGLAMSMGPSGPASTGFREAARADPGEDGEGGRGSGP